MQRLTVPTFSAALLCALTSAVAADDTTFVVKNATDIGIAAIFASPTHMPNWPPKDPLPDSAIPAGGSVKFTIKDGACAYDFLIVFDDSQRSNDSTDVCEIGTYVVTQ